MLLERAVKIRPRTMRMPGLGFPGSTSTSIASTYNPRPDPLDRALRCGAPRRGFGPYEPIRASQVLADVFFFRRELDAFFAEAERTLPSIPTMLLVLVCLGQKHAFHAGDERGITLVRKAIALDPFHPTWFHFPIALYHFERGEYEEALVAARKIDIPGLLLPACLSRRDLRRAGSPEARLDPLSKLLKALPGFHHRETDSRNGGSTMPAIDSIRRWVAALRKAGLPE